MTVSELFVVVVGGAGDEGEDKCEGNDDAHEREVGGRGCICDKTLFKFAQTLQLVTGKLLRQTKSVRLIVCQLGGWRLYCMINKTASYMIQRVLSSV